ncbi:MAG TPA: CocE/NonD family hydrolase, partial [Propylenella sp.]|nr:CocE/NonD family hydrolase [Propylenella sp.]
DGYRNTPMNALEGLGASAKAILGPWVHKYPHFAAPEPRLDFHAEAIAWWDRWLKGENNGAERLPALRAYVLDAVRPARIRRRDPGCWIAEPRWPPETIGAATFHLTGPGGLSSEASAPATLTIRSPQDCGTAAGEYFTLKPDAELPLDQRIDDAGSLVFQTEPLDAPLEILGRPLLTLRVAINAPLGNLAARLVDVHPDGAATRVSFGVLNLAHRDGNAEPRPVEPGVAEDVQLALDAAGYRFRPGHRVRLSISTAYWPMILPPPTAVTATIATQGCQLTLPVRTSLEDSVAVPPPPHDGLLPAYREVLPPATSRRVERDLSSGLTRYLIHEDTGASEHPATWLVTRQVRDETWSIDPDDPLSMTGACSWVAEMSRGDWSIRTVSTASLSCTAESWVVTASVQAYDNGQLLHTKEWSKVVERDHM